MTPVTKSHRVKTVPYPESVIVTKYYLVSSQELQRVVNNPSIIKNIRHSAIETIEYISGRRGLCKVIASTGVKTNFIYCDDSNGD